MQRQYQLGRIMYQFSSIGRVWAQRPRLIYKTTLMYGRRKLYFSGENPT
jgi:hypothetical protein